MKRVTLGILMLAIVGVAQIAGAWQFEYMEGKKCDLGADIRLRLTHVDRDTYNQNRVGPSGPARQYLRMRTRVWGCFELAPDVMLEARAVNQFRQYSTREGTNDIEGGGGYQFPDEVVIDRLVLSMANLFESDWSLSLGRQDVILGTGMVMLEGTPVDAGRTIYFDGAVATYKTEADTLKLFALANGYKDRFLPIINDQNRVLRWGNTWTVGADWTHTIDQNFNTELYYMYVDVDDDFGGRFPVFGLAPQDSNAEIHIAGLRVFGKTSDQVDYSVEFAQQFGNFDQNGQGTPPSFFHGDITGNMIDARLGFAAAEGTTWSPKLTLSYTYLSGDNRSAFSTGTEMEGWMPVFAAYPIWREELMPNNNLGAWTNMHQYRAQLVLNLRAEDEPSFTSPSVKLTSADAWMLADLGEWGTGGGDNMGQLVSGFLDIGLLPNFMVKFEASTLFPGNFYQDGDTSDWLRFESVFTF